MAMRFCVLMLGVSLGIGVSAQTRIEPATAARFETALLRPSRETVFQAMRDRSLVGIKTEPGRISAGHVMLIELIRFAYQIDRVSVDEVVGPDWLLADEKAVYAPVYDVEATFPEAESSRVRQMLQVLLTERFGLNVRVEGSSKSASLLVAARGGLTATKKDRAAASADVCNDDMVSLEPGPAGPTVHYKARTTGTLARLLSMFLAAPVVDRTDWATAASLISNSLPHQRAVWAVLNSKPG